MPFGLAINTAPIVYGIIAAAVIAAVVWMVDVIGDRREAKVWGAINAAIEKTNTDVRRFNDLDGKIAAIADDARIKALEEARQIAVDRPIPDCKATEPQAKALSRIK